MRTHARGWQLAVFAVAFFVSGGRGAESGAVANGRLVRDTIAAPSLAGNQLGDPAEREIAVYLPPSYAAETQRHFPVVYFLGGFNAPLDAYLPGGLYGSLVPAMERAMAGGQVREMIVVMVSGCNALRGSFYVNSPVSGNWEDHVVREVVTRVDAAYRTQRRPEARGLSGHSMGGFGALNLAMRHPEVFGWCYALSPSLLEPDGLAELLPFENGARVTAFLAEIDRWRGLPLGEAQAAVAAWRARAVKARDQATVYAHAYGAAFAPSAQPTALGFDYPFSNEPDGLHLDAECWWRWEAGLGEFGAKVVRYQAGSAKLRGLVFEYGRPEENRWITRGCGWEIGAGKLKAQVAQYRAGPAQLRGLAFEYGQQDENRWMVRGCEAFCAELTGLGVPHMRLIFDGGHSDRLEERLVRHALPYFSEGFAQR